MARGMGRVLVMGGSGNISAHAVEGLVACGHEVAVLNRGQTRGLAEGVRAFVGDREKPGVLAEAVRAFRPQAVVDFVCFSPAHAEATIRAGAGRVEHVVFVSTVDVQGYPLTALPAREGDPGREPNTDYARDKRSCEGLFREAAARGDFALTITRPTYCLGRGFVASFLHWDARFTMRRLREGRPVLLVGNGEGVMHPSTARDCGRQHAALTLQAAAYGRTFHAGSDGTATTHRGYLEAMASHLGVRPVARRVPRAWMEEAFQAELKSSLWEPVMRHDLSFSFAAFREAFPDFRWSNDLRAGLADFVERVEGEGAFTGAVSTDDLEASVLKRADEAGV